MKLDANRKYTFAGDVYRWNNGLWLTPGPRSWSSYEFQYFADNGLVAEVKEPERIEFTTSPFYASSHRESEG